VRRVGAVVEHAVDVKLIAATQVALREQVEAGQFRADLYHRLAVVVLELPPLRERGDDILMLARTFLQQYAAAYGVSPQRLSKAAEAWLLAYHWPGNVRELSHLLERVVLLEMATVIDPESLARRCLPQPGPAVAVDARLSPGPDVPPNDPERFADALRQSGGNLTQAARLLGLSRGVGIRAHRTADPKLGGSACPPAAVRERTVCAASRVPCGRGPANACPSNGNRDTGSPPVPGTYA
jgi:two-component system, NtrC family, response regulator AtoC